MPKFSVEYEELKVTGVKREYKFTIPGHELARLYLDKLNEDSAGASRKISMDFFRMQHGSQIFESVIRAKLELVYNEVLSNFDLSVDPKFETISCPVESDIFACIAENLSKSQLSSEDLIASVEGNISEESEKDFVFVCSLTIASDIPDCDVDAISISVLKAKIDDEYIESFISKMEVPDYGAHEEDAYNASEGDIIALDFLPRVMSRAIQGGDKKNIRLEIGNAANDEVLVQGLNEQLLGCSKGMSLSFNSVFGKRYQTPRFADKPVAVKVEIKEIFKKSIIVERGDLVKKYNCNSEQEFVDLIRKKIEGEFDDMSKSIAHYSIFKDLAARYTFPVNEDIIVRDIGQEAAQDPEKFREAEDKIRVATLILDCAKKQNIAVRPEEVIQYLYSRAASQDHFDQLFDMYNSTSNKNARLKMESELLEAKIFDYLFLNAKKEESFVSPEDLRVAYEALPN